CSFAERTCDVAIGSTRGHGPSAAECRNARLGSRLTRGLLASRVRPGWRPDELRSHHWLSKSQRGSTQAAFSRGPSPPICRSPVEQPKIPPMLLSRAEEVIE